ncbi:uncharacterized protein LOC121390526 isoform X2 [Gigantopelta aegis]|uniref:uncharacterized protein LOC121390526 isoform X2 n=1 Tax=Gigantopelta aegis TaxID=1735272 RepID=UPI001B88975E|nr:uncharacterized protein LOC121390526 isoform X2 [Gigantopelta aegis]
MATIRLSLCIFGIHSFLYAICLGCNNLFVVDNDRNSTDDTILARQGKTLILVCDGSCQGRGFTPALQWFRPNGDRIHPFPGRLMSVPSSGRRHQRLYIRRFGARDVGRYTCKGWVKGRWKTISRLVYMAGNSI